jgi:Na+/H+ antiporter NhaD/arsenite permease-like protein
MAKDKVIRFIKNEPILIIANILAIITCFFIPIDKEYLKYFQFETLICLLFMLTVVAGLKSTNVFELISKKMIALFHNRRSVIYALVFGTFFLDMIVANDMSLITFLPLTYIVLHSTGNDKYLAFTFIMQNIAANMGGMVTPYGNPQNLYIYSFYNIGAIEFFRILFIPIIFVALLLFICCSFIKQEPLTIKNKENIKVDKKRLIMYLILFIMSIGSIFRIIPYTITLIVLSILLILFDKKVFIKVDYALLLTFCAFFVFSGNIARISIIKDLIYNIININTFFAGIISCQLISNVPTAIFLSQFTNNYKDLLISVNIGSLGIITSSLASLITIKEFLKHQPKNFLKYIGMVTIFNTMFLILLIIINKLL